MATLNQFMGSPWKTEHAIFKDSDLALRPAPEYASSEVLLSALYRRIGLEAVKEREVPVHGRDLLKRVEAGKKPQASTLVPEQWSRVLQGALESPKLPNQSAKRFLQLTPLVPEIARYSGSARLAGSPWAPGNLVERMVLLGSLSLDEAHNLWQSLYQALAVDDADDVWARWVDSEFGSWTKQPSQGDAAEGGGFSLVGLSQDWPGRFHEHDGQRIQYPAKQFVRDLKAVIEIKDRMTRRQWTSLLEAVLRVAAVAHVLWLGEVHQRVWSRLRGALFQEGEAGNDDACSGLWSMYPANIQYFRYGSSAMEGAKAVISRYLYARLEINLVLWSLEERGIQIEGGLSSQASVDEFISCIQANRAALLASGLEAMRDSLHESEARTLSCTKGVGSNMYEFVRHCAGQRQTARDVLRGYDQGYSIRKHTTDPRSRWIVALGPVSVIAMAHCCLHETGGARSVHRLCDHLQRYGIAIGKDEVGASDLGHKLRLLGLVLDSPDAESGMLVLPPFANSP